MTNWKASLIHLGISAPLVLAATLAMALVWFPSPFFRASGGGHLILILASVDLIIGPFLTLLVYKSGKRHLRLDLTIIGLIQISALLYGAYTIFLARPAYVVFAVNQFEVVTAADIPAEEQQKANSPEFLHSPLGRFRVVGVRLPVDIEEQNRILFAAIVGHDLSHFPQHYVPYESQGGNVAARGIPIPELRRLNPGREQEITDWVAKFAHSEADVRFVPVRSLKRDVVALVRSESGELLDFAAFIPWE